MFLALAVLGAPLAGAADAQDGDVERGFGLVQRGMDMMRRGLLDQVEPTIDDAEGALRTLGDVIGRLDEYQTPEVMPNGDILIRRRQPHGPDVAPEDGDTQL